MQHTIISFFISIKAINVLLLKFHLVADGLGIQLEVLSSNKAILCSDLEQGSATSFILSTS